MCPLIDYLYKDLFPLELVQRYNRECFTYFNGQSNTVQRTLNFCFIFELVSKSQKHTLSKKCCIITNLKNVQIWFEHLCKFLKTFLISFCVLFSNYDVLVKSFHHLLFKTLNNNWNVDTIYAIIKVENVENSPHTSYQWQN